MASKPKGAPAKYTVRRSPVEHDGETYRPGETIELTAAEAGPLLAVAAIEAPAAGKEKQPNEG